jgi:hypothetical protein
MKWCIPTYRAADNCRSAFWTPIAVLSAGFHIQSGALKKKHVQQRIESKAMLLIVLILVAETESRGFAIAFHKFGPAER